MIGALVAGLVELAEAVLDFMVAAALVASPFLAAALVWL